MKTAKALGFKKGDFVHTGIFPGVIIGDAHTATPLLEVWGIEHECGSAYAQDLRRLTFSEFQMLVRAHNPGILEIKADTDEARKALEAAERQAVAA